MTYKQCKFSSTEKNQDTYKSWILIKWITDYFKYFRSDEIDKVFCKIERICEHMTIELIEKNT